MIPVLTRAQMRAFDKEAIETFGVPGIVLMENAGRGAADVISALVAAERPLVPSLKGRDGGADFARRMSFPVRHVRALGQPATYPLEARIVVICGAGNNGGDGFVVARHLLARGAAVETYLLASSEKVTGEARINLDAYVDLGGSLLEITTDEALEGIVVALRRADLAVDALFGTGLYRKVEGHLARAIEVLNEAPCRVLALDVPSGLDADTGAPHGLAVMAEDTVTFAHLKIGLLTPEGAKHAGRLHVVDLGIPDRAILDRVGFAAEVMRPEIVGSHLAPREANVHKHRAGNVLVLAGSPGKLGASVLTARGALRAGAGLVTIGTWSGAADALDARAVELMTARVDEARLEQSLDEAVRGRHSIAIGPGFGTGEVARRAVHHVVLGWAGPMVVDADALTAFTGRAEELRAAKGKLVLTPHAAELGRLLGRSAEEVERDRFGVVREAAEKTGAVVVLKGARSVVASPGGDMHVCMAGNPILATAGSGDVLGGIVAALLVTLDPFVAASSGVLVHALAGDRHRARFGMDRGLLASEIAEEVPVLMGRLARGEDPLA